MKWGQSSPWRSSNSTYSVAVIICSWECRDQVTTVAKTLWRSRYVNGKTMTRPPCSHVDSHGCGVTCQLLSVPLPQMTWLLSRTENRTITCLADKRPRSLVSHAHHAVVSGYCVSATSRPPPPDMARVATAHNQSVHVISRGRRSASHERLGRSPEWTVISERSSRAHGHLDYAPVSSSSLNIQGRWLHAPSLRCVRHSEKDVRGQLIAEWRRRCRPVKAEAICLTKQLCTGLCWTGAYYTASFPTLGVRSIIWVCVLYSNFMVHKNINKLT